MNVDMIVDMIINVIVNIVVIKLDTGCYLTQAWGLLYLRTVCELSSVQLL